MSRRPTDRGRKAEAAAWFATLRDRICAAFEAIEDDYAGRVRRPWPTARRAASSARPGTGRAAAAA